MPFAQPRMLGNIRPGNLDDSDDNRNDDNDDDMVPILPLAGSDDGDDTSLAFAAPVPRAAVTVQQALSFLLASVHVELSDAIHQPEQLHQMLEVLVIMSANVGMNTGEYTWPDEM